MKTCSLNSFLGGLEPWLNGNFIAKAASSAGGQFTLYFLDGTRNVYQIDDCCQKQVKEVCANLEKEGISVEIS